MKQKLTKQQNYANLFLVILAFVLCVSTGYANYGDGIRCGGVSVLASAETIAFGEKASFNLSGEEEAEKNVTWQITPAKGVSKASGKGKETGEITFKNPGTYIIRYNVPGHTAEETTDTLVVLPVRMQFDFSSISFSKPIEKDVPTDGTEISVEVKVSVANGQSFEWSLEELASAGVGTSLIGTPQQKSLSLTSGKYRFSYTLSGQTSNLNIMFDFKDLYGRVQAFYLLPFLNNRK